jgi:PadR family transcriptional regulator PadR
MRLIYNKLRLRNSGITKKVKPLKNKDMDLENTKAQMRKGILEYCILSVLSKNSCYASDIIKELKEAQVIVVEGTLYPLLTRQKNAGLLSYRWEESQQGPPRKYYELTPEGQNYLTDLDKSWDELVDSVNLIRTR